jgi:hypothetical protein
MTSCSVISWLNMEHGLQWKRISEICSHYDLQKLLFCLAKIITALYLRCNARMLTTNHLSYDAVSPILYYCLKKLYFKQYLNQ